MEVLSNIRPVITVSPVNDESLSKVCSNLNPIVFCLIRFPIWGRRIYE